MRISNRLTRVHGTQPIRFGAPIATLGAVGMLSILCWLPPSSHAALPGDAAEGRKLHDAHCMSCHDSSVYTRSDRQVSSLGALKAQLGECTHAAQITLTDPQQQSVIKYLNEQFYKFKP